VTNSAPPQLKNIADGTAFSTPSTSSIANTGGLATPIPEGVSLADLPRPNVPSHLTHSIGAYQRRDYRVPLSQEDWSRVLSFDPRLDHETADALARIEKKFVADPKWRDLELHHGAGLQAAVLVLSTHCLRFDHPLCGEKGVDYLNKVGTFPCQDRLFCHRCCWNKAWTSVNRFGNSFGAGYEVWFMTISPSRDPAIGHRLVLQDLIEGRFYGQISEHVDNHLPFETAADVAAASKIWQFIDEAIFRFSRKNGRSFISGAFGGPEIGVKLLPLGVVSHCHHVVYTTGLSIDHLRTLLVFITRKMRACRFFRRWKSKLGGVYPSVVAKRITSRDDLIGKTRYLRKPIDLAAAYSSAIRRTKGNRAIIGALNQGVNTFVTNAEELMFKLPRIKPVGNASTSSNAFVGEKSKPRKTAVKKRRKSNRKASSGNRQRKPRYAAWKARFRTSLP
jgi:hypothetical protein